MSYRVLYTQSFTNDIADHVDYLRQQYVSSDIIERWYDRLFSRIEDLGTWPKSCSVDESASRELGREVRKLVYARYVVTYEVDETQQRVLLLAMVHGASRR